MWTDPIVEEIHQIREAYAARFDFDFDAIYEDIKQQERESGREFVNLTSMRLQTETEGKSMQRAQRVGQGR